MYYIIPENERVRMTLEEMEKKFDGKCVECIHGDATPERLILTSGIPIIVSDWPGEGFVGGEDDPYVYLSKDSNCTFSRDFRHYATLFGQMVIENA